MDHLSGTINVIRAGATGVLAWCATRARLFATSATLAGALALAGCYTEEGYQLPTRAMKELSPEMVGLLQQKNMPKDSPILVRVFKEESELEVWKQDTTGQYQLLKVYPICRWSGELGPKKVEGDRQAPEGFYSITPGLMNPNSNYYLAINIGFPNAYDKSNGYSGNFLMIHGDCSSRGCYAMTDEQIGEIYSLAREAFLGGEKAFQIQAYPFRLTAANLARHRTNPNMAFWRMLKEGDDHFQVTHQEPKVDVCEKHYVFDAQPPAGSGKTLSFSPSGRCPAYQVPDTIAGPALEKSKNDDFQVAELTKENSPVAPVTMGTDGGMNRVFASKLQVVDATYDNDGHIHAPPIHPGMPAPTLSGPREDPQTGTVASRGLFGNLLAAKSTTSPGPAPNQVATAAGDNSSGSSIFGDLFKLHSSTPQPEAPAPQGTALAGANPKADARSATRTASRDKPAAQTADTSKTADASKSLARSAMPPKPQQDTSAPPTAANGMMRGSQPVVPAGTFDGRWAGVQ
jgi:murein L,D-transpeptidase YafK